MNLRWGKHQYADPKYLHAIDLDKNDGNPFSICGKVLLSKALHIGGDEVKLGESREGKCPKCFKISRKRLVANK